jgi:hypothetical protein
MRNGYNGSLRGLAPSTVGAPAGRGCRFVLQNYPARSIQYPGHATASGSKVLSLESRCGTKFSGSFSSRLFLLWWFVLPWFLLLLLASSRIDSLMLFLKESMGLE